MEIKLKTRRILVSLITLIVLFAFSIPNISVVSADTTDAVDDGIVITTTLDDNITQKGSKKTIDVIARQNGNKIDSEVYLNNEEVKINWSDSNKDSYTLNFVNEGPNVVKIIGKAGDKQKEIIRNVNYVKAQPGEIIGYATFSLEALTIGSGYLIEPLKLPIYEGENSAQMLVRWLEDHKYSYRYTGEITKSFYLATIGNGGKWKNGCQEANTNLSVLPITVDKNNIPAPLWKQMEEDDVWIEENGNVKDGKVVALGEFDYTGSSGWMYSVNDVFPNVGFADTFLSDGDVVRVQFTLHGLGADIGGRYSMGGSDTTDFYDTPNKTQLLNAIADVNSSEDKQKLLSDSDVKAAYDQAMTLGRTLVEPQEKVDEATKHLIEAIGAYKEKINSAKSDAAKVDALIDSIGTVEYNDSSKKSISAARAEYDKLSTEAKALVTKLDVLISAEKRYEELKAKAEEGNKEKPTPDDEKPVPKPNPESSDDIKAAKDVDKIIEDIGDINNITLDSIDKINQATKAYNALSESQKKLVKNLDKLKLAIEKYNKLKNDKNINKHTDKNTSSELIKLNEVANNPKTGDNDLIFVWLMLICTCSGVIVYGRKRI